MNERRDPDVTSDYLPSQNSQDTTKNEDLGENSTQGFGAHSTGAPPPDLPTISGYRVTREIARGGMGRVLAAIDLTLNRDVAIKILLPGAPPDRFIRESQITARLPHPGIPPVYSLGTLQDGSPYLAMKLIDGRTLISEIKTGDRQQLLQIFLQICQAVGFAHSRGIIHRDLKPANVMVGAFGEVQVMDWGLAKDLNTGAANSPTDLAESRTSSVPSSDQNASPLGFEQTEMGVVMGTPSYMSPEQARGEPLDARVDVFALGGILYSMLTKSPPFMGNTSAEVVKKAASADLAEAFQKLERCDADPDILSICRRCLSPKPADRPIDGQAVAAAISHYLSNLQSRLREAEISSAQARERESAAKRTRKVQVIAASLIFMALGVGLGISLWQYRVATKALGRAVHAEGEEKKRSSELAKSREQEKQRADDLAKSQSQEKQRADELSQVAKYQADMLAQVNIKQAGSQLMKDLLRRHHAVVDQSDLAEQEKTAKKSAFEQEMYFVNATDAAAELIDSVILTPAIESIDAKFAKQPLVDASLRATLGHVYKKLGRNRRALELSQRSFDIHKEQNGEHHLDTLDIATQTAAIKGELQDFDDAEKSLRAIAKEFEERLGPDNDSTLIAKLNLADLLYRRGEYGQGETIAKETYKRRLQNDASSKDSVALATNILGQFLLKNGKFEDAEKLFTEQLESERNATTPSPTTLNELGNVFLAKLDFAKAEVHLAEAVALSRKERGENHPGTLLASLNLAQALAGNKKLAEAEKLARKVLEETRQMHGNEHADTLVALNILAIILNRQLRFEESEPFYSEALQTGRKVLGENHPEVVVWVFNQAVLLQRLGRYKEAEPLFREAVEKNRRTLKEDHPSTITALRIYADFLRQTGNYPEAEKQLLQSLDVLKPSIGEEHAKVFQIMETLGGVYREQGKLDKAEECFQKILDWNKKTNGDKHPNTSLAILRMATVRVAQQKHELAIELLTPLDGKFSEGVPANVGALRQGSVLGLLGKSRTAVAKQDADFKAAESNLLEAQSAFAKIRGEKDRETLEWTKALIDLYTKWNETIPNAGHDKSAETWKAKLPP